MDRDKIAASEDERVGQGKSTLSEKQELILARYFDQGAPQGQKCSLLRRASGVLCALQARRLLGRSEAARRFFDQLEAHGDVLRAFERSAEEYDVDCEALWQKVRSSIEQEEYVSLLKGERRTAVQGRDSNREALFGGWRSGWWSSELVARMRWALSGAAVSAAAVMVVLQPQAAIVPGGAAPAGAPGGAVQVASLPMQPVVMSGDAREVQIADRAVFQAEERAPTETRGDFGLSAAPMAKVVSLGDRTEGTFSGDQSLSDTIAEALAARQMREQQFGSLAEVSEGLQVVAPRVVTRRNSRGLEVDWMRSRGRVHVIHDPVDRSSIFWVKPNRPFVAASGNEEDLAIPFGAGPARVIPTAFAVSAGQQ